MRSSKSYTEKEYYQSYIEYTGGEGQYGVDLNTFRSILMDYFKYLSAEVIENAKEIRLPARLGSLFVKKKRPKRYDYEFLRVDFRATKDVGKTVMHLNEHSNGYNYMFRWSKTTMYSPAKSIYELVMSRENKRHLARCIKNNKTDYIEI